MAEQIYSSLIYYMENQPEQFRDILYDALRRIMLSLRDISYLNDALRIQLDAARVAYTQLLSQQQTQTIQPQNTSAARRRRRWLYRNHHNKN